MDGLGAVQDRQADEENNARMNWPFRVNGYNQPMPPYRKNPWLSEIRPECCRAAARLLRARCQGAP